MTEKKTLKASSDNVSNSIVRILPETLINKIAAGEVVERPASVVKELLENAIDAGAKDVHVTVKNGGKDLISILDNGCGMNESDAQLAVERHATSKIFDEDDLFRIQTLGFRGEALASIASVSHFEMLTCNDENQGGTRIQIKGGYLEELSKTGFPKGTKITVERLFYNTPARLKFLKTTATELQHIQQHILQKSLAHPDIHFRLTHNRQLLLNLTGGQGLEIRIQQIFGEEFMDSMMPVKHEETYLQFSGFVSFPSKPRTSRRWQYIFVNNRNVKSPAVNHGIYDGYGIFLGKNQHPAFFLNMQINPTEIDVNVHPAKTEIRFRNSQLVHTILADQISRALKECASRRFFGREHSQTQMSYQGVSGQIELPMDDPLPLEGKKSAIPNPEVPKNIRVLGQFRKAYIIAENEAGLVLIEQRALHQRLLYDIYVEALQKQGVPVQTFKASLLLELSPQESALLEQHLEPLAQSGFAVSPFGGSTFAVNSIPKYLEEDQVKKVISEILDRLALFGKSGHVEEILRDISLIVAEFASMNPEQQLTLSEMESLLAQWEELGSPLSSLQDIPFLVELSVQELERRLRL